MSERLKGKRIILVGAGSTLNGLGNGKAAAVLYARHGARVMLVDRELEAAENTRSMIDAEGGESFAWQADVTRAEACRGVVEECVRRFGGVDVLHNNVGITRPGGVVEMDEETWDMIMAVNVKSMFLMCKYAIPAMESGGGGAIVNIASIAAVRSLPAIATAYCASKAAVIAMTREIAYQYAARGIRANAVLPGLMETPMVTAQLVNAYGGAVEQMHQKRAAMAPMQKQGTGWDTAQACLYLVSDEAAYVTGTTVTVDGGLCTAVTVGP